MFTRGRLLLCTAVLLCAATVGCADQQDPTVTEIGAGLAATFPVPPEPITETMPGTDLTLEGFEAEFDGDTYGSAVLALPPGTPFDLSAGEQGAVDSALADVVAQTSDDSWSSSLVEHDVVSVAGAEGRRFVYSFINADGDTADYASVILTIGDEVVQLVAIDVDGDSVDAIDGFIDSLSEA